MPLNNPITPALLADPEIFQQNRLLSTPILRIRPARKCP